MHVTWPNSKKLKKRVINFLDKLYNCASKRSVKFIKDFNKQIIESEGQNNIYW